MRLGESSLGRGVVYNFTSLPEGPVVNGAAARRLCPVCFRCDRMGRGRGWRRRQHFVRPVSR